jgi:GT2 family glycosyltransferase
MDTPLISVIIIEYFCLDDLSSSLLGIKTSLSKLNYEIIITSNSCYDIVMQSSVKQRFPEAIWVFNEKNGGFAYGMNQGLKRAKGRYLVISNPDAVVIDGFVGMIEFLNDHSEVGAIGPQLIDKEDKIQDSCRSYVSIQSFFIRQLRRALKGDPLKEKRINHSLVQTVDWIAGAFIMVRRNVFEDTNGLDEKYFLYAEDMDWCARIRQSGNEIVYYPKMHVLFSGSRRNRKLNSYSSIFINSHLRFWNKFGFFSGYPERKEIIYE